jgi:hypothetical protein
MVGELVTLVNVVRSDGKYLVENSFDKFIAGQRKYTSSSISDIKKISRDQGRLAFGCIAIVIT